jgi:hypothetical protein
MLSSCPPILRVNFLDFADSIMAATAGLKRRIIRITMAGYATAASPLRNSAISVIVIPPLV